MSSILYNIIIAPIELIVEIVFEVLFRLVGQRATNQGLALIGVSLTISLLTLPLYRRADIVQQKQRDIQNKLAYWVNHIKKTFKGDEQFMMLQTYYRQNNYSPLSALNGSISLLLEVPFFIAAYHFLSHLDALNGASFVWISDLGKPDSLIKIGGYSINLLPILMTTINCVSAAIYLKGFPFKDKFQTYGMAVLFLILLYNSPSGLVVYWTCNNIFSLVKNIFYKLKNPRKVLNYLCIVFGILIPVALISKGILNSTKKYIAVFLLSFICFIPYLLSLYGKYKKTDKTILSENSDTEKENPLLLFVLPSLFLIILTGILIPSSVISSSPAEFIDLHNYQNPVRFIVYSACYAIGFFLLWSGIVFKMVDGKAKQYLCNIFLILSICSLFNFMCFGRNFGILSSTLIYEREPVFLFKDKISNLLLILVLIAGICLALKKLKLTKKVLPYLYIILILSTGALSIWNIKKTSSQLEKMSYIKNMNMDSESDELDPILKLSTEGKNVIVFMLDRAISGFIPMIFEEKPELKQSFNGFTYYPNTISFGTHTIYGAPPLFGGYEYTPTEMNARTEEKMIDKHNEALKVLPKIFSDNNFNIVITDAPFANYQWVPDLSIFNDIPNTETYITSGRYEKHTYSKYRVHNQFLLNDDKRNFFCYSVFKVSPYIFQSFIYDNGDYLNSKIKKYNNLEVFIREYSFLDTLTEITEIEDDSSNHFLMLENDATHNPTTLYLPDYTIAPTSTEPCTPKFTFETKDLTEQYQVNMACLLKLGEWFDFMKKHNVWDNTRIIIVSDHGRSNGGTKGLGYWDYMIMKNPEVDVSAVNPLLLIKDFDSNEFTTSNEFMTNADVPVEAVAGITDSPVNPFTNKKLTSEEKNKHPQLITFSHQTDATELTGNSFDTSDGQWLSVHDNIFDESNWKLIE